MLVVSIFIFTAFVLSGLQKIVDSCIEQGKDKVDILLRLCLYFFHALDCGQKLEIN